jgi:hypothetical protein
VKGKSRTVEKTNNFARRPMETPFKMTASYNIFLPEEIALAHPEETRGAVG